MSSLPFKCPVLAFMRDYGPYAREDRQDEPVELLRRCVPD
jgi:hypothetical protein